MSFRWTNDGCHHVFKKEIYAARFAGSAVVLLHTHSLRCGLEECRQLHWLNWNFLITGVLDFSEA